MSALDFQMKPSVSNLPKWLLLKLLSLVYGVLIRFWLFFYCIQWKQTWSADKPVISIGNITMGGTGKTPMVGWMLDFLITENLNPAVLTRGYKAKRQSRIQVLNRRMETDGDWHRYGDEPWLLSLKFPQVPFYISPDRVAAAAKAQSEADILILDDGMQHRRLWRDLDIIMIDAMSGIGNSELFPLGPLREPLKSLSRADVVIYSRTNLTSSDPIRRQIAPYLRQDALQFDSTYHPDQLIPGNGRESLPASALNHRKCLIFSGIGNPEGFRATVAATGARVLDHLVLNDHQVYHREVLDRIRQLVEGREFDYLICTEKDWVKLEAVKTGLPEIYRLSMAVGIDPAFEQYLSRWLASWTVA